jgi:Tfp pilus assembly protein PilZ
MTTPNFPSGKYHVVARLFELMNTISEDQLVIFLKELLKDGFSTHIFKLVIDMPDGQQAALLKKLEESADHSSRTERRRCLRKPCLMPVDYSVLGRQFKGYILDISAHGVFIETTDYFFSGQEIIMTFSVPHYQKPMTITGKIVWSSQNGIGIKFSHLTNHQVEVVRSFSENREAVYEITS